MTAEASFRVGVWGGAVGGGGGVGGVVSVLVTCSCLGLGVRWAGGGFGRGG